MSALPYPTRTIDEYLAQERAGEIKREYIDGEIVAMSGASEEHNLISGNIFASIHTQLRKKPCKVYASDMRVRVNHRMYTYPDISALCGEANLEDDFFDTLLNPSLIIEVLSPSTERYDRGKKSQYYRTLNSLRKYVLISQDEYRIERYTRQADGQWLLADFTDLNAIVELTSIGCSLLLADVYDRVEFTPP